MPRVIASNDKFDVLPPGLLRGLKLMLGFGRLEDMNWRVVHKSSGEMFALSDQQHEELEQMSDRSPGKGPQARQAARDALLAQIEVYWEQRQQAGGT